MMGILLGLGCSCTQHTAPAVPLRLRAAGQDTSVHLRADRHRGGLLSVLPTQKYANRGGSFFLLIQELLSFI